MQLEGIGRVCIQRKRGSKTVIQCSIKSKDFRVRQIWVLGLVYLKLI